MGLFEKWIAVVLATINPLTGRGITIPLGVEFGLPLIWVCVAAGISNFILAAVIILVIDKLGHIPAIKRYIEKKRGKKTTKFIEGKGLFYAVIFGPLVLGTFTVILVFQSLGTDNHRVQRPAGEPSAQHQQSRMMASFRNRLGRSLIGLCVITGHTPETRRGSPHRRPFKSNSCYQARFLNSLVRVSISILSPISMNAATGNSKPVLIFAGFITLPEVSPRTAGSV